MYIMDTFFRAFVVHELRADLPSRPTSAVRSFCMCRGQFILICKHDRYI